MNLRSSMHRPSRTHSLTLAAFCILLPCIGGAIFPATAAEPSPVKLPAAPKPPLVDLAALPDPPLLDIRYATRLNFTGEKLYSHPVAWLHQDAADALGRVQRDLRGLGFGLKVLDAYRPPAVQQLMWDLIRDERYVSNPQVNQGRHTRGTAVDVSLVDLMGNPLPMPSGFDDFSDKAHRDYEGATKEEKANAILLEEVMTRHGFEPLPTEWWHYDLKGWQDYPVIVDP